ncbi:hypothetical protein AMECASPLE_032444 [Ameca splendens]|uniref:Uncharacterized protein n=1 Tax=Ameca splendens TaxID=208324 RepID=A0ABV0ZFN9_9TELE
MPDTQTANHYLTLLHVIVVSLDPGNSVMPACQQETLAFSPSSSVGTCVEEVCLLEHGVFIQTMTSQEVRCFSFLFPVLGCAGSRLMQFMLKVPEKFLLAFNVVNHGLGPNRYNAF